MTFPAPARLQAELEAARQGLRAAAAMVAGGRDAFDASIDQQRARILLGFGRQRAQALRALGRDTARSWAVGASHPVPGQAQMVPMPSTASSCCTWLR